MIKKILALSTAAVALLVNGCSGQAMVNALTPNSGYKVRYNVVYGELPRQKLDIYTPDHIAPDAPTVVFFYGGSWRDGDKGGYKFLGEALASHGIVTVVPNYRLYPQVRYPAFVEDGALAVKWARDNISAYGGNPNNLFLMGHSAGAYIAAMLALDHRFLRQVDISPDSLRGTIGMAGPYDFLPLRKAYLKRIFGPPSRYASTQPINYVNIGERPFLLMAGKSDTTVAPKNTLNLGAALQSAGNRARVIIYPHRSHVGLIAALAAPLRFLGPELSDIVDFIHRYGLAAQAPGTALSNARDTVAH